MCFEELVSRFENSCNPIFWEAQDGPLPEAPQIPEDTALGQAARHVKRLTVSGYFRLHGAQIPAMTRLVRQLYPGNKTVVATDIWGGIFAIGNGDFPGDPDIIWYHAPDTLRWETMRIRYEKFLEWMCSRRFFEYHSTFLWKNMEALLPALGDDQGVMPLPPLWEAPMGERNRWQVMSFEELLRTIRQQEQG